MPDAHLLVLAVLILPGLIAVLSVAVVATARTRPPASDPLEQQQPTLLPYGHLW